MQMPICPKADISYSILRFLNNENDTNNNDLNGKVFPY